MVQPGNKRVQRAKAVHTNGGPMKAGLVPLTGKSVTLFNIPRQCCTHRIKKIVIVANKDAKEVIVANKDAKEDK